MFHFLPELPEDARIPHAGSLIDMDLLLVANKRTLSFAGKCPLCPLLRHAPTNGFYDKSYQIAGNHLLVAYHFCHGQSFVTWFDDSSLHEKLVLALKVGWWLFFKWLQND